MMPDINRAEAALIEYKEAMEFYKAQYDNLKKESWLSWFNII